MDLSESEILREVCILNGIEFQETETEIYDNTELQIIFTGFRSSINFQSFPYLCELVIIAQDISEIACLDSCPMLKKLWVCECQIEKIENLEPCHRLQELYMYGNAIERIENISHLTGLRLLNLADNSIQFIEGLSLLKSLASLNLSGNSISHIGCNLEKNESLRSVCLSGNKIRHISEILNVRRLPKLQYLNVNEAGYPRNPMCNNPNYIIAILYYLPHLTYLDGNYVSHNELFEAAQSVLLTKQTYYMTRFEANNSTFDYKVRNITAQFQNLSSELVKHIKYLDKNVNILDNVKSRKHCGIHEQEQLSQWINCIRNRLISWTDIYDFYCFEHHTILQQLHDRVQLRKVLYQLELEMWGNFQFMELCPEDTLFDKCTEWLVSRFCLHEPNSVHIAGLRIHHMYRVSNRILEAEILDSLKCLFGDIMRYDYVDESHFADSIEEFTDFNYLILPIKQKYKFEEIIQLLKYGFFNNSSELLKLYSCLNDANDDKSNANKYSDTFSRMIIVKSINVQGNEFKVCDTHDCISNLQSNCYCSSETSKTTDYNKQFLLPEFIMEIEYIYKNKMHLITNSDVENAATGDNQFDVDNEKAQDEVFLKRIPDKYIRHISKELTESSLEVFCEQNVSRSGSGVCLSLCDIHFPTKVSLQQFTSLTHLSINHCGLSSTPNINGLPLKFIDLSHNRLASVNNFQEIKKLYMLNLSFNCLSDLQETVTVLEKACSNLSELSIRANPWIYRKDIEQFVTEHILYLKLFNGKKTKQVCKPASEYALKNSRTDLILIGKKSLSTTLSVDKCSVLTIYPIAEYLINWRKLSKTIGIVVWSNISTVCLQGCNLRQLENMERLINLQSLSVNDNYLTTLDGILGCSNLKEVSAERNCISNCDGVSNLHELKRLLLGNNLIKTISNLNSINYPSISVLSLRSNKIQNLNWIQIFPHLSELYLGNNHLTDFNSVLLLKRFHALSVLDLSENPVAKAFYNYRTRIIFHMKSLKALDGEPITKHDIAFACEQLGGLLSVDFLIDRLEQTSFYHLTSLDLPNCSIKQVDYIVPETLPCLKSVNLERNQLTSFSGLLFMKQIHILCLNDNNICSLFPRTFPVTSCQQENVNNVINEQYISLYRSKQPILPNLKMLHLGRNQVSSLQSLSFNRLPFIRTLFLQHNEISNLVGLQDLKHLKELVLDCNKIKEICDMPCFPELQELHIENNRLKEITALSTLENLRRLYVGGNKLNDPTDLERFACGQQTLVEISMVDNPIQSRQLHRLILAHGIQRLQVIDGTSITDEERDRANAFYSEQELQQYFNSNIACQTVQTNSHNPKACSASHEWSFPGLKAQKLLLPTTKLTIENPFSHCGVGGGNSLSTSESSTQRLRDESKSNTKSIVNSSSPLHTFPFQNRLVELNEGSEAQAYDHHTTNECLPGMKIQSAFTSYLHQKHTNVETMEECITKKTK